MLQKECDKLRSQLAGASRSTSEQLGDASQQLSELRAQLSARASEGRRYQEEISNLQAMVEDATQQRNRDEDHTQRRLSEVQSSLTSKTEECSQFKAEAQKVKKELSKANKVNNSQRKELDDQKAEQMTIKAHMETTVRDLHDETVKMEREVHRVQQDKERKTAECESLEHQIKDLRLEFDTKKREWSMEVDTLKRSFGDLTDVKSREAEDANSRNLNMLQALQSQSKEFELLRAEKDELLRKVNEMQRCASSDGEDFQRITMDLKHSLAIARSEAATKDKDNEVLRSKLTAAEKKVADLLGEMQSNSVVNAMSSEIAMLRKDATNRSKTSNPNTAHYEVIITDLQRIIVNTRKEADQANARNLAMVEAMGRNQQGTSTYEKRVVHPSHPEE